MGVDSTSAPVPMERSEMNLARRVLYKLQQWIFNTCRCGAPYYEIIDNKMYCQVCHKLIHRDDYLDNCKGASND